MFVDKITPAESYAKTLQLPGNPMIIDQIWDFKSLVSTYSTTQALAKLSNKFSMCSAFSTKTGKPNMVKFTHFFRQKLCTGFAVLNQTTQSNRTDTHMPCSVEKFKD